MSATNTKRRPSSSSPPRHSQRLATKKTDTDTQTQTHTPLLKSGLFYMALLALQFGFQPIMVQAFIPKGTPGRSIVIVTEMVKIVMCFAGLLLTEPRAVVKRMYNTWTLKESLLLGFIPAGVYAFQNTMAQKGYQNLDSLTFNLLNQTKTLFAAICLYVVLGKKQTPRQLIALAILLTASIILNWPDSFSSSSSNFSSHTFVNGVVPVLLASFTSGICAALTQKTLQGHSRNSYLYSAELAVYGQICLVYSLWRDSAKAQEVNFFDIQWTPSMFIPIVTNATGGIIVGLVTKYAGGVKKGFALIAGIVLSALFKCTHTQTPPTSEQLFAALLVGVSMYMHVVYNDSWYAEKEAKEKKKR